MGEELAGAADAALHFIEDQQQAVLVAKLAQCACRSWAATGPDAAFALYRLDQDARRLGPIAAFERLNVAEGNLVEAFDLGAEAFEIFRLAAGGDGGERAAVKGALEGDEPIALRVLRWPRDICAPS